MKKLLLKLHAILLAALAFSILCCGSEPDYPISAVNMGPALPGFVSSDYGYAVYDVENRRSVMNHNFYLPFIPASVTKLVTAVLAIETLGRGFRFSTEIFYTGKISDGVINGNIYLKGDGDPELSISELAALARRLAHKGVKEVNGNFYYDESAFSSHDMLDPDMSDYAPYNSGIGALNLNRNTVHVLRSDNKDNNSFTYEFLPPVKTITSELNSSDAPFPFVSYTYKNRKETWLLPAKKITAKRQPLPVKHSGSYTASVFKLLCSIYGLRLNDPLPGEVPKNSRKLCSHESRTLDQMIQSMLVYSDNLTAEILGRVSCKKYAGNAERAFPAAVDLFFREKFPLITHGGFILTNASGLSTQNRLTPEQTIAVLIYLSRKYPLEEILPMSGETGTLKYRFDSPDTAYRVYAKTESISYSSALAGLFYGASGKKYLFVLFIDNKQSRAFLDSRKPREKSELDSAAKWSKRASDAADQFISNLIRTL
jgi:D-alanyl-D-alanine carboxypeptidase/D-alanyl-D-alanine-endopeptidase (penicillin-binding protein 4)